MSLPDVPVTDKVPLGESHTPVESKTLLWIVAVAAENGLDPPEEVMSSVTRIAPSLNDPPKVESIARTTSGAGLPVYPSSGTKRIRTLLPSASARSEEHTSELQSL